MKKVAETLANILENPVVQVALDRTRQIEEVLNEVKDSWRIDLESRSPAPAYKEVIDGVMVYQGTDFDLFTFMNALAEREAVINLPNYERIAPKTVKSNQRVISDKNRHGSIMGVVANQDVHSFSVRIKDYNVIEVLPNGKEVVGAPRNFALVDYNGKMYDGWHKIEFKANAKEKNFLNANELWDGETIVFENFVHPNLANAFYGSRYIATKALGKRVKDEASFYRKLGELLRDSGVRLGGQRRGKVYYESESCETESTKVGNLEAVLILPDFRGLYPIKGLSKEGEITEYKRVPDSTKGKQDVLRYADTRAKDLSYSVGPELTADTRAVELAYFLHGFIGSKRPGNEREPGWNIPKWDRGYTIGNGRTEYNALHLNDDVTLAYRLKQTSVKRVA